MLTIEFIRITAGVRIKDVWIRFTGEFIRITVGSGLRAEALSHEKINSSCENI